MKTNITSNLTNIEFRTDDPNVKKPGFFGYGSVFGVLDAKGSIITPGAFLRSIPKFLTGFNAIYDCHSAMASFVPVMKTELGYYVAANEDDYGLFLEGEFHSTHAGQEVYLQLKERTDAGLLTGLSIGFEIDNYFRIFAKDFETELPKYCNPKFLMQALEDSVNFAFIDIITEATLGECSITNIPANVESFITEVRSKKISDTNSAFPENKNSYNNNNLNFNKINMEQRSAKRLGKESYSKLDNHLSKVEDHLDDMDNHVSKEGMPFHKDAKKACRALRAELDSLHSDDEKDAKEPDGDEEKDSKRSFTDDELTILAEKINTKINKK